MEQVRDLHSTLTDTCLDKITANDKTKLKRPVDFFCHPAKKLIGRILRLRCVYIVIRNIHDLSVNGSVEHFCACVYCVIPLLPSLLLSRLLCVAYKHSDIIHVRFLESASVSSCCGRPCSGEKKGA